MPKTITRKDGNPLGPLQTFTFAENAMPVAPDEGAAGVPSISATYVADDIRNAMDVHEEDVLLEYNEWGNLVQGRVNSVRMSAGGSKLVAIDAEHPAAKLNADRDCMPMIRPGYAALPLAMQHWAQECGLFQHGIPGDVQIYIPSGDVRSIGWVKDAAGRPISTFQGGPWNEWMWKLHRGSAYPLIAPEVGKPVLVTAIFDREFSSDGSATFHLGIVTNDGEFSFTGGTHYLRIEIQAGQVFVKEGNTSSTAVTKLSGFLNPGGQGLAYPVSVLIEKLGNNSYRYSMTTPKTDWYAPAPIVVTQNHTSSVLDGKKRISAVSNFSLGTDAMAVSYHNELQKTELPTPFSARVTSMEPTPSTGKLPDVVTGFSGNVWNRIKEACALYDLDLKLTEAGVDIGPRERLPNSIGQRKSGLNLSVTSRDAAKTVEVEKYNIISSSAAGSTKLWQSESTYTVNRGERQEHLIQTDATFTRLENPEIVNQRANSPIPWPYGIDWKGTYMVWGNDGYPITAAQWNDGGGSISVEMTDKAGEFKLIIQGPHVGGPWAPFKIMDGPDDRPALTIFGNGIMHGEPKTITMLTGAKDAKQKVGTTFDSTLVTTDDLAYNAAARLSEAHNGSGLNLTFNTQESAISTMEYDGNVFRADAVTVTPAGVNVSASSFNTVQMFNDVFSGKTVGQYNTAQAGKKLKTLALYPFERFIG